MTLDPALARLAEECATAQDRVVRRRTLANLRRAARRSRVAHEVMEYLATLAPGGAIAAAEWLGGDSGPLPRRHWTLGRCLLSEGSVPSRFRIAVGGRLLDALPARLVAVQSVVVPLTEGLTPARRLEWLRQLERYAEFSPGLTRLVVRAERATFLGCLRCEFEIPAAEFADHLWGEHGLTWDGSASAEPSSELGAAVGAAAAGETAALDGAFAVWGGHKGSGLAMMVQLLGMMCGADAAPPRTAGCGFLVMVTDPAILTSADDFKRRVSAYAASVRGTRPLDSGRPVRVPFDRSAAERERHLADGTIRVPEPIHQALLGVADDAGG